ncbi:MAG TPA: glycosyltransferase [Methylovorus sp.]|nr:glycosyltransferase [Methylovorus sp.]
MKKIAVVIPAYGESSNIVDLCKEILHHYAHADILIVDDSPDLLTVKAIKEFAHPQVTIKHREKKGGRGSAVILGIIECLNKDYEYFLEIDADFSHPPSQIPSLIKYADEKKIDLLIASRYLADSKIINWPLSRKIFSKCANVLARVLLRVPVYDYTNGFRLYSHRSAVELTRTCGKLGNGFIALSEILVNLHYRQYSIGEVPTIFVNRIRGESSLSRKEIWNALSGLGRIYKLKRRLSK